MRAPTWRSISWVLLVDRRVDTTARGDATVSELLLDRGPSARYAMMICSRSFMLLRSLAALQLGTLGRGRRFDKPVIARSRGAVQPAGVLELNGCHVSKLRQDCSYLEEQRCSHLRATHGRRVDSCPALMVPTPIRSELRSDAPDFNR